MVFFCFERFVDGCASAFSFLAIPSPLYTLQTNPHDSLLPETKGRSLEEMDVIFGAVDANTRRAEIEAEERAMHEPSSSSSGHQVEGGSVKSEGDVKGDV